jgi:protein-disulfide isomerase
MSLKVPTRRGALAGALALAALPAWAGPSALEADDMAIGDPKAPVTVVEYASTGCPHCARWSNDVFPAFKAKYVDTGKVRFVVRECLTGDANLAAAGFMLARCAGPKKYFDVIKAVFAQQRAIAQPGGDDVLRQIGAAAGVTGAAYEACLSDKAGFDAVSARSQRHADLDKVQSTPTFDINGKILEGFTSLDDLGAAIAEAAGHKA